MIDLGVDKLKSYIKTIGLYNNKAKNVIAMSEMLIEKFHGKLPRTRDEIQSLPGLGRKSANVIMNELLGAPYIAVDTHVIRLSHRLDLVPDAATTPEKIETELEKITPGKYKRYLSNYLVLYGRYTCTARKPKCPECGIRSLCRYYREVISKQP
jgi:endonuclease-3